MSGHIHGIQCGKADEMNLLLHICCAPCSVACIEDLRGDGIEPTGFWYNPNIHGVKEYRKRKNTLIDYSRLIHLKLLIENEYGLRKFIDNVYPDYGARCAYCYACRLEETARYASENGYDSFSSTLLISPYQKHDLVRLTGEKMAERYGIEFVYRDFRPLFREGQEKAKELGLYRQQYCGCIFSEEDRYLEGKKDKVTFQKFNNRIREK